MAGALASAADTKLVFEPAATEVKFTLDTTTHVVHGTFALKSGEVIFDPATGKASGQLVVDALSGQSGSGSRDGKMHKSVLESSKYTTVTFVPDRVEGSVAMSGTSKVQVHGKMNLHGADHELTIPVEVNMESGKATASSHFLVPFLKWGLKNPSMMFFKVNENVEIDIRGSAKIASGTKP